MRLNGMAIRGSPVCFSVATSVPDIKTAQLTPPADSTLFANTPYSIILKTFDRFNNPISKGGLPVTARLQLIKSGVHDLTTLMPTNHTV